MMKLTEPKIYLAAAEMIFNDEEEFSCLAVGHICRDIGEPGWLERKYKNVMLEGSGSPLGEKGSLAVRNLRILLLCMMAACCKSFPEDFDGDGE